MSFTAGYDRLKRLYGNVQGKDWQNKIEDLKASASKNNLLEISTIVKGLSEEIVQHARTLKDPQTLKLLHEFLSCLAYDSPSLKEKLAKIQANTDDTQKQQAFLELLLSVDLQHLLSDQLKQYLNVDCDANDHQQANKRRFLDKALAQRLSRCLDDITVLNNQASYDDTGRIVKRIFDILTFLADVILANFGIFDLKLASSSEIAEESGHKPQTIMPMPMKM